MHTRGRFVQGNITATTEGFQHCIIILLYNISFVELLRAIYTMYVIPQGEGRLKVSGYFHVLVA